MRILSDDYIMNFYRMGVLIASMKKENKSYYFADYNLGTGECKTFTEVDRSDKRFGRIYGSNNISGFSANFFSPYKLLMLLESGVVPNKKTELDIDGFRYIYSDSFETKNGTVDVYADMSDKAPAIDLMFCKDELVGVICINYETVVGVLPGYEDVDVIKCWESDSLSSGGHGVIRYGTYDVEMRDGIKLKTDVYLPADYDEKNKYPTIFLRTAYNRHIRLDWETLFADRGYAVVLQDIRGTGESEGDFPAVLDEDIDSYDTMDWIVGQKWSDGKIGSQGGSYSAYWQVQAIASCHPALKCSIPMVAAISMFDSLWRRSGSINAATLPWMLTQAAKANPLIGPVGWELFDDFSHKPVTDFANNSIGFIPDILKQLIEEPDRNGFLEKDRIEERIKNTDTAIMLIAGLYDSENEGDRVLWNILEQNNVQKRKMIIGPWYHFYNGHRKIGEFEHGPRASVYNFEVNYLKWYDRYLKNIENGIDKDIVEFYVSGCDKWECASEFPPKTSDITNLYLSVESAGVLSEDLKAKTTTSEYISDPENVVVFNKHPEIYGRSVIPQNVNDIEQRDDVISFTTDPADSDFILVGDATVEFYASSTAPDTDFVGMLCVVDEEGNSVKLTKQLTVARYRNGYEKSEYLEPGKIYKFTIKLPFVSHKVLKGQSLRLDIFSSAMPEYLPNPQVAENPFTTVNTQIATNCIYSGKEYPSVLKINIIKD